MMAPLSAKIEVKVKMHSTLNFQLRFWKIKLCFLGLKKTNTMNFILVKTSYCVGKKFILTFEYETLVKNPIARLW